jgi:amphi-Trp domain-containing protein
MRRELMSGGKVMYKSEQQMSRSQLVAFLRDVADRLENETLVLKSDDQEASIHMPEQVELEVEYQSKEKAAGPRYQLELEVEWGSGTGSGVRLG